MTWIRHRRPADGDAREPRDEAAQVLAGLRHRGLHRRRARDRLPAYLVIGPPGMGKSDLLQRSGLRLERAVDLASSSWWVSDEALFVEAAPDDGRTATRHPVLPLLRRLRAAVPVSGILLVLSPADLTLADIAERTEMSEAVSRFLRAFEAQFRYAPPLYVVVSKLDLTPGFTEFFDRLEAAEREQPWGFTLPVGLTPDRAAAGPAETGPAKTGPEAVDKIAAAPAAADDAATAYRAGFRRLLDAIRARLTQWITPETDPVQCSRILGFGAQVAALEATLKPIVEPLIPAGGRRWAGAWLRGVYLTSTQQDALAIDALLPDMAKRFGLPRTGTVPPDLGRDDETLNYFVDGTFRRVILPEAGLAQRDHIGSRRAALRGWTLTAAAVLVCAGLGVACTVSYQAGVARIVGVNAAAATLGTNLSAADPAALPSVLSGLSVLEALGTPAPAPGLTLSLDAEAQALIARQAEPLYARALATSLQPHLTARLARDLVTGAPTEPALRIAVAAAETGRADRDGAMLRWLRSDAATLPAEVQTGFLRHGEEALQRHNIPVVEPAYTDFARATLGSRDATR